MPTSRDWIFSIKTFVAAMLALYVALKMELPRPYWAVVTVYVVSNPFAGATTSKALYRMLGTLLGATVSVLVVPVLIDTPYLMSFAVAVWMGVMLFLSISDRTAKSYMYVLSSYTTAIIVYPTVFDPASIFDVAAARTEEILVGIVVASIVNTVLFPSRLAPMLSERTVAWFRDAADLVNETLAGNRADRHVLDRLGRMASTVNGLEVLLSQLAYDGVRPDVVASANEQRGRMALLLPIIVALAEPLCALLSSDASVKDRLVAATDKISAWISATQAQPGSHPESEVRRVARELRTELGQMEPAKDQLGNWHAMLLSSILWRLNVLVEVWEDCITLQHVIAIDDVAHWRPQFRHWRFGAPHRYFDPRTTLFATVTGVGAIFAACVLWISSDWVDGGLGVAFASIVCCFFAGKDDPTPSVRGFLVATVAAVAVAGAYLFGILPAITDFAMLVIVLAVPFVGVGALLPSASMGLLAFFFAVNAPVLLNFQSSYQGDFQTFLNSSVSVIVGCVFAYVWTLVTRPFGAEWAVKRITLSSWRELAIAAGAHAANDQPALFARMLDRLMQLIPRLEPSDDPDHATIAAFRDIRAALNMLDLRIERENVPRPVRSEIDAILGRLQQHYSACVKSGARQSPGPDLVDALDHAIAQNAQAAAEGLAPASLRALVLLRISLSPGNLVALGTRLSAAITPALK
jgi:uncharacterized membrane protein YccC